MGQAEAEQVEVSWRRLRRAETEFTPEAVCKQAQAVGQIAACDGDNLVLVDPGRFRMVAMNEDGHFDQATAERVLKALRTPADC